MLDSSTEFNRPHLHEKQCLIYCIVWIIHIGELINWWFCVIHTYFILKVRESPFPLYGRTYFSTHCRFSHMIPSRWKEPQCLQLFTSPAEFRWDLLAWCVCVCIAHTLGHFLIVGEQFSHSILYLTWHHGCYGLRKCRSVCAIAIQPWSERYINTGWAGRVYISLWPSVVGWPLHNLWIDQTFKTVDAPDPLLKCSNAVLPRRLGD